MDKNLLLEIQKIKNLYTYNIISEQRYAENTINIGGKIVPISLATANIYNAVAQRDKNATLAAIKNNIKTQVELNVVMKELQDVAGTNINNLLHGIFTSAWAANRTESDKILNQIKTYLAPIANVEWKSESNQYIGGLNIQSKYPNVLKYAPETPKKDDAKNTPTPAKDGSKTTPHKTKQQVFKEKFPLLFQMKGQNILKLQQALGVKATGYFYKLTEAAVAKKMKEMGKTYNRKTGVDITTYNQIISGKQSDTNTNKQQSDTSTPTFTGDFASKENVQKRADIAAQATEKTKQLGIQT
jgi:hypothetical protein